MQGLINSCVVALCCFIFTLSALAAPTTRDLPCNGQTSLCNRKYSNVSFIGAHDSAFVGPLPTQNQDLSVTAQLNGGIRFLQAQTHNVKIFGISNLRMCHTSLS